MNLFEATNLLPYFLRREEKSREEKRREEKQH